MVSLTGRLFSGQGVGHAFTQIDWVRAAFIEQLGIDPYPGTLNLLIEDDQALAAWQAMQRETAVIIRSPNPDWCDAHAYPVRIAKKYVGAIIVPQLPHYLSNHIEIIATIPLRQTLALQDDMLLRIDKNEPISATGIIFDVDGTLVDSIPAYLAIAKHGLNPFGIDVSLKEIRQALNENNPNVWEDFIPADRSNRQEIVAVAQRAAIAEYPNALQRHASLLPNVATTLSALKRSGFRLAIMTGSWGHSMKLLDEANLLSYFETVVTGRDVAKRKPDPEGLCKAASNMNLPAESLIYVGDSIVDMEAARKIGMGAIGVLSGAGDGQSLTQAGAHWLLKDISQLTNIVELPKTKT